ncbi:MAG: hypothetical protein VKL59_03985 [Nostocaceae cyanobacterium]|nr:hypothetical protein [Nostocaceae cyanobacterium]
MLRPYDGLKTRPSLVGWVERSATQQKQETIKLRKMLGFVPQPNLLQQS